MFKTGFYVDDIDAAWRWLRYVGVDADARVFTDQVLGVRTFVFRDPEGNRLQVLQRCAPTCAP